MSETASFPYELRSVPAARRFVRGQLSECGEETVEAAELMVSELATNAIRHAESGFELSVLAGEEIRVEVTDSGRGRPRLLTPGQADPSGRGLRIVQGLAKEWGVTARAHGKSVWFTLGSPAPSRGKRRSGRTIAA